MKRRTVIQEREPIRLVPSVWWKCRDCSHARVSVGEKVSCRKDHFAAEELATLQRWAKNRCDGSDWETPILCPCCLP